MCTFDEGTIQSFCHHYRKPYYIPPIIEIMVLWDGMVAPKWGGGGISGLHRTSV